MFSWVRTTLFSTSARTGLVLPNQHEDRRLEPSLWQHLQIVTAVLYICITHMYKFQWLEWQKLLGLQKKMYLQWSYRTRSKYVSSKGARRESGLFT
uniref:Retrotransposon protein SINE subclass n=1 Tax=Arundo donax TaxID=35708 RepID=A0A0A9FD62_ARUDO